MTLLQGQILGQNHGLRTQEMAFPGFKFQKISWGACPRTPLALRVLVQ